MKKLMLLLAVASLSTFAMAQETTTTTEIPTLKHSVVTNGFWDNWFIDFGGEWMTNYSNQEKGFSLNKNPFARFRGNGGIDVSVGKWITPVWGARAKVIAAWGRQVGVVENVGVQATEDNGETPLYNGVSISLEPMLNLHNLIGGYKPRVWNAILYGSCGYYRDITDGMNSPVIGGGLINQFNVTKRFHINIDIYGRFGDADMDGIGTQTGKTTWSDTRDWQIGWSLGCGFNLGKVGWSNAPDVDAIMAMNKAQVDALNSSLADQQAENNRLKDLLAKKPKEVVKTVDNFATTPVSVFFNLNKSTIASKKDLVNVKEVAEYAKANNKKIVVTGYADSKTGSSDYNQTLSEARANTVVDQLVNMGVSRDNIEVVANGGVDSLSPYTYNRRAVVSIK